jgi:hypothetical protein
MKLAVCLMGMDTGKDPCNWGPAPPRNDSTSMVLDSTDDEQQRGRNRFVPDLIEAYDTFKELADAAKEHANRKISPLVRMKLLDFNFV